MTFRFYTSPPVDNYKNILWKFSVFQKKTIDFGKRYIIDSGVYELQKHGRYNLEKYKLLDSKILSNKRWSYDNPKKE